MKTENLIDVNIFCVNYNVELSFISLLQQNGLMAFTTVGESWFIEVDQLKNLEQIVHFYYELDINLAGIETITHLLKSIQSLQDDNTVLRNKLRLYEEHPLFMEIVE